MVDAISRQRTLRLGNISSVCLGELLTGFQCDQHGAEGTLSVRESEGLFQSMERI